MSNLIGAWQAVKVGAAEAQSARAEAAGARKTLQGCQSAERLSREREGAASAEAQELRQESLKAAEELKACSAALRAGEKRLGGLEQAAATEKEVSMVHITATIFFRDMSTVLCLSMTHFVAADCKDPG